MTLIVFLLRKNVDERTSWYQRIICFMPRPSGSGSLDGWSSVFKSVFSEVLKLQRR